jgi:hypothetical protein
MKLYDNRRIGLIIIAIICGLGFTTYLFYEQLGKIGQTEILILSLTTAIAIIISVLVIRKGNK